ncbi:MAG: DUF3140 domain-containing protein [Rhodocyclaceae bacterium]|nr:DUF3140 domain-containing protein [Rhodocyclaceae bacterium]MDQ8001814.1 DUF3140 domain-containing protein [Pseudomonadota bacterium]MDQ8017629.1 DUF3140 domain-containing protein [Pseudomonadota bacterium]
MATSSRSSRSPRSSRTNADADTKTDHVLSDFKAAVNMTPAQLERWLQTDESRTVGFKGAPGKESVGHASGRRIVRLLGKDREALTTGDLAHMRKVVGYVHRHLAQRPSGNVRDTPWRQSLMNWGHDPLKRG